MSLSISSTVKLRSGYSMPLLGLGVYQNTGPTAISACAAAFSAGYRHIDSAQVYKNEAEVGRAFTASGLKREDVFITSKVNSKNHGYQKALDWIRKSLDNFDMQYIDLFLIHDPLSGKEKRLETWKALIKAKEDGHVRSIGVSNYGVPHLEDMVIASLELPSVNQIELHPFCQQKEIVQWCKQYGVVVEAYCPLMRGARWNDRTLQEVARKYGKTVPQVLIRWSLQMGYSPLPKSANADRVISNAQVYDFELEEEDMVKIEALDEGDKGAVSWNPVHAP
ncbi:Aldo/keto reductase [Serendipita vermifera]|nr:Aldo/keto reductase [Serendipita vermifera]